MLTSVIRCKSEGKASSIRSFPEALTTGVPTESEAAGKLRERLVDAQWVAGNRPTHPTAINTRRSMRVKVVVPRVDDNSDVDLQQGLPYRIYLLDVPDVHLGNLRSGPRQQNLWVSSGSGRLPSA